MQGVGFLLLAGGQSRRMGGGDKNQLNLGGKSVLHHILDRVDRAGAPTAINANGDPLRFEAYGLPVIADVVDGYAGPLAGILGFEHRPLVSVDFARDSRSSVVDGPSTMVTDGTLLKVYAWYDNELGYSCRMVDLAKKLIAEGP